MIATYDSGSPQVTYDSGLLYDQPLPEKGKKPMARAKGELAPAENAATHAVFAEHHHCGHGQRHARRRRQRSSRCNAPHRWCSKINAVVAAESDLNMLRGERDAQMADIIDALTTFIAYAEAATGRDPVKLQSLGLPLRSPPSPPAPCTTVVGLLTSVGDNEGELTAKMGRSAPGRFVRVQISPDPIQRGDVGVRGHGQRGAGCS